MERGSPASRGRLRNSQHTRHRRNSVIYVYPGISIAESTPGTSLTLEDLCETQYHDGNPRMEKKHSISSEPGCDVKITIQAMRPHTKFDSAQPARFSGIQGLGRSSTEVPTTTLRTEDAATYQSSSSARRYSRLNAESIHELRKVKERILKPILRFRRAAKTIMFLIKATRTSQNQKRLDPKSMSFSQYQDEIMTINRSLYSNDLVFDPLYYKPQREMALTNEAKAILTMDPEARTEDQVHVALVALQQSVGAFGEFPIAMQKSLARVGWYENFEAKRVIIREGHTADNFYLVLSGTVLVTILSADPKTGENFARTVAVLGKGNSFGELALMHGATRSATVTCKDNVELLAVGREDFVDIFMHVEKDKEPEHIQYLRKFDVLLGWPIEKLPWNDPKICLLTYFRRGVVMCRDSNNAEWIYFIKSGSCRILKTLKSTEPNIQGLEFQNYSSEVDSPHCKPRGVVLNNTSRCSNDSNGSSPRQSPRVKKKARYRYDRFLPPITQRVSEEDDVTIAHHQKLLDKIFKMRHLSSESGASSDVRRVQLPKKKERTVFVQIQSLGPKQSFGLEHVAFCGMHHTPSVSLVSDGTEAVLISRKFFNAHLSDDLRKQYRSTMQPYPDEDTLQVKLQNQTNWDAYKSMTINDHVTYSKYVQNTLNT